MTASEQGYKETGNAAKDVYRAGFVQVVIRNFDSCTGLGWFESGMTSTPATVVATGPRTIGRPLTVTANVVNLPLAGINFTTGEQIYDTVSLNLSGTGIISASTSKIVHSEYAFGGETLKTKLNEDSDSGQTSAAAVRITSTRLGAISEAGWFGSVARVKSGTLTLIYP